MTRDPAVSAAPATCASNHPLNAATGCLDCLRAILWRYGYAI